jgi:excisionase family DNA binding protein
MSKSRRNHGKGGESPPAAEELLTVNQVAENWQVSERTIRRMIEDGRLPARRVGRAVRIPANVSVR